MLKKTIRFLKSDLWRIRLSNLPKRQSVLLKYLRVITIALRGFVADRCQLRASALTFYSIFAVVPVLAMTFAVAKGFGLEDALRKQILTKFTGQEEVASYFIEFAHSYLESAKGGVIAGVGIAILFWAVIRMLSSIETSFNDIWGTHRSRGLARRFTDYLAIILVCPVLLIVSSSMTVFLAGKLELITQKFTFLQATSPLLLRSIPYIFTWALFSFIYKFMPNTDVSLRSAAFAAVIAGTMFHLVHLAYVLFQIGASRYGAIYGSFAALPLLLMWLQLSWLIVLFGAKLSFAHQNVETYEFEPDCLNVNNTFKKLIALRITNLLVKGFCEGARAMNTKEICDTLEIPIRLSRQIIYELTEAGVLAELKDANDKESAFHPALCVQTLSIKSVLDAIEKRGTSDIPVRSSRELAVLKEALADFDRIVEASEANILLRDI